jgi:hypothetical protein
MHGLMQRLATAGLAALVVATLAPGLCAQPEYLSDPSQFIYQAALTDFETFPDGNSVPYSQATLDDEWSQVGFLISDSSPSSGAMAISNTGATFPHSGTRGLTDGPSDLGGFIRFDVVDQRTGQPTVVWEAGIWVQNGDAGSTVSFYDAAGGELASFNTVVADEFVGLRDREGIAAIEISDGAQYMVDDLIFSPRFADDKYWRPMGGSAGVNGTVRELEVYGDRLFAGGDFASAGGVAGTTYLAGWNGSAWTSLGTAPNATVWAMTVWDGKLIVGGEFTNVGARVAAWNGSSWESLGAGFNGPVYDLLVWNGELYASGAFYQSGGAQVHYVGRWNGTAWEALGTNQIEEAGYVYSMTVYRNELIVAGYLFAPFDRSLVRWDGDTWSVFEGGGNSEIDAVAVWNGDLYVGGVFSEIGNPPVALPGIARWDGSEWQAVGDGLGGGYIWKLLPYDGALLAVGSFVGPTEDPGGQLNGVGLWDGTVWHPLGSGSHLNYTIWDAQAFQDALYVGGDIPAIGGQGGAGFIARWEGPVEYPSVILPTAVAPVGQSFDFRVDASDNYDVQSVTLYYRRGGQPDFGQANLAPQRERDGSYSVQLGPAMMTDLGLEYYLEVSDGAFTTVAPATAPDLPAFLTTSFGDRGMATPPAEEYILFGFPFQPTGSAAQIIQDDLGAYDPANWRLGRWDPTLGSGAGGYREYPGVPSFAPGRGYWLIQKGQVAVSAGGNSTNSATGITMALDRGWTQIAAPYLFPVNWADCVLSPGIDDELWGLVAGSSPDYVYELRSQLEPWEGYWVHNSSGSVQALSIPGIDATALAARTAPDDWALRLLHAGGRGHGALAAVNAQSSPGLDALDAHCPPAMPGAPALAFLLEVNGEEHQLATDARGEIATAGGALWTLGVSGRAGAADFALAVEGLETLSPDLAAILLGPSGLRIDLRATPAPRLPLDAAGRTQVTLAVGTAAFIEQAADGQAAAVAGTHLAANYPNPFNPKTTLPFSLAAPAQVRLAIYDVAGRLQRTLVDAHLAAGEHWVNWDGRDEAGGELASGVYFSRFEAGATSEVRKLLLLR